MLLVLSINLLVALLLSILLGFGLLLVLLRFVSLFGVRNFVLVKLSGGGEGEAFQLISGV